MVDQRDTADVSYTQVEARAVREGAPALESHDLPCSQTSLSGVSSSENSGILPTQQLQQKQITKERKKKEGKEQASEEKGDLVEET